MAFITQGVEIVLNAVTGNVTGPTVQVPENGVVTFVANYAGGTGSATITIYGALPGDTVFLPLGTMSVSNTTPDALTFPDTAFMQFYGVVSGYTGSGSVSCHLQGVN